MITTIWDSDDTFVLCASPCVVSVYWAAAAVFAFFAIIMYQIIVKHVS